MDYRLLGASGFKVPVLTLGTGTFGGRGELFKAWGSTDVAEAKRLVDLCLEAGLNMFDSADIYSGRRGRGFWARPSRPSRPGADFTKATFRSGSGANESAPRAIISFDPSIAPCVV
ncbi:MAG: aldo/keto reductase [Candidatus Competibacteraceae bacterium]